MSFVRSLSDFSSESGFPVGKQEAKERANFFRYVF